MKTLRNIRGAIPLIYVIGIAVLGLGGWGLSKTKWFHGESKRAATSTETTNTLLTVNASQDGKAAAVFTKIGETNAHAPDSPEKRVISRFVPIGLSLTGAPDAAFLLELEKLKVATLTGKLDQVDKINATLMQDAAETQKALARAISAKRASDMALEQAAAEARGAQQQAFWLTLVAIAAGGLYVYTKLTHTSPWALAKAVVDIKQGTGEANPAIAALDGVTTPLQQLMVKIHTKLAQLFT
jgi:hypothetical protein